MSLRSMLWVPILLPLAACQATEQPRAVPAATAAPREPKVRVHVLGHLASTDAWYEDEFSHDRGADLEVSARPSKNGGVYVDIASAESRKTSGCALTIYLREDAGETIADALGNWWMDTGSPSRGHLEDLEGDIYLAKRLGQSTLLELRFALTARKKQERVLLMGGVSVVPRE